MLNKKQIKVMQNQVKRGRPRKTVVNNPTQKVVVKKVKMNENGLSNL